MAGAAAAATLRVRVHLQPRAARDRIVGPHGDGLRVQVHAPPTDGAANAALIALLANACGVSRSAIRILAGITARHKLLEIACRDPAECRRRLATAAQPHVDKPARGA